MKSANLRSARASTSALSNITGRPGDRGTGTARVACLHVPALPLRRRALLTGRPARIIAAVSNRTGHPARFHPVPTVACRRINASRLATRLLGCLLIILLAPVFSSQNAQATAQAQAQTQQPLRTITGDRLSGFVLPVEPQIGEITFRALRASQWTVDDTQRLVLDGDTVITIGHYRIEADAAVVWLNRIPSQQGVINQVAVFFRNVRNSTNRAGIGVFGRDVLLTGSAHGEVQLHATLDRRRVADSQLVQQAEQRLAEHLQQLQERGARLAPYPQVQKPQVQRFLPQPGVDPTPLPADLPDTMEMPPLYTPVPQLIEQTGIVRFAAELIEIASGEDENTITCAGGLVVEYLGRDPDARWSRLTLTAQRAVIFTDPGTLEQMARREFQAGQIRGIYLEGHVTVTADDGRYSVRAPKVYYDFQTGQAIMLGAVLRTYTRESDRPFYARAEELRQIAANQWQARGVRVSSSEFAVAHIALGAEQILITQEPSPGSDDDERTTFLARGNTLRLGGTPVFYWPTMRGTVEEPVLKGASIGSSKNDGFSIRTRWDLITLLGRQRREGFDATLRLDGFTSRGVGAGVEGEYQTADVRGRFDFYLQYDDGTDRTSAGRDVRQDDELRGVGLWEHHAELTRYWYAQAQVSYISDPTYISAWRTEDFRSRRPYETSLYLQRLEANTAFSILGQFDFNNFIATSDLLSSRAYQVDRMPELAYHRFGDSFFGDSVTYFTSTTASRLRMVFQGQTPDDLGIPGEAFGIGDGDDIAAALRARGLREDWRFRADSRHELAMPLRAGDLNITPFLVGRITAYDNDFDEFSSDSDSLRLFGAAGVRLNTEFMRIDDSVESILFDLHRMRHIIEPNLTLWYGYASVDQTDLPIFDEHVESLSSGAAVRIGLHQTWQTQRGGPGFWRNVDVFTLDTDLVLTSGDTDRESPIPQYFGFRPEQSQLGDHVAARAIWQVSDSLLLVGRGTYDLDDSLVARSSLGVLLSHSPIFSTFIEYRSIDAADSELLGVGWNYQLTPTYFVALRPEWDLRRDEFRRVSARVVRRFPEFDLIVRVERDEIRNDTSIGASIDITSF